MNTIADFLVLALVLLAALCHLYVRFWKNAGKCDKGGCGGQCGAACHRWVPASAPDGEGRGRVSKIIYLYCLRRRA